MNKYVLSLLAAGALALTIPAVAQQKKEPEKKAGTKAPEQKVAAVAIPAKTFVKGQEKGQYLARTRLIGQKVLNKDGAAIGDIEDVIVSSGNTVEGVIVGVGGFLGVGEKKIGVRYSALKIETKDGKTTVSLPSATKEVLAELQPYQRSEPAPKSLLQKAGDTAKDLTKKAGDAAKGAYDKAKAAVKPADKPAEKAPEKK